MKRKRLLDADVPVSFNLSSVVANESIEHAIESAVAKAIEAVVADAVHARVSELVNDIGKARISAAIDTALAEGWRKTNEYGEANGPVVTLKDRIGQILNARNRYGDSAIYIDQCVKQRVDEALNKDLKADIEAARSKFKNEVDAVLTATIREALAKNLGLK